MLSLGWSFDVVGHLIEFLIDTDANFLVETQRIGDFSNHEGYVMGYSSEYVPGV